MRVCHSATRPSDRPTLPRSEHPQRVGKSPAELLNGQAHAHWLELLGYQRYSQDQAA